MSNTPSTTVTWTADVWNSDQTSRGFAGQPAGVGVEANRAFIFLRKNCPYTPNSVEASRVPFHKAHY
jgi:hypothetical protein